MARKKASSSNIRKAAAAGSSSAVNGNGNGHPSSEDVAAAKEQHNIIKDAQQKPWKHAYFKPDLSDPQIVGGSKETALVNYNPGIVISEKGREKDKKLDEHEGWEFGGPWGVTAMMTLFPLLMYYLWICE